MMTAPRAWTVVAGLLLVILVPIAYLSMQQYKIHSSEPFQIAVSKLRASSEAQKVLGSSIESGWLVRGEIVPDMSETVIAPVSGTNGRGALTFRAERINSVWTFPRLQLWLPHGVRIVDLSDKPASALPEKLQAN